MWKICRTCFKLVPNKKFVNLSDDSTICKQLAICIPTMNAHLMVDPVMCISCVNALNSAYEFTSRCLRIEEFLRKHPIEENPQAAGQVPMDFITAEYQRQPEETVPNSDITAINVFQNSDNKLGEKINEEPFTFNERNFESKHQTLIIANISQGFTSSIPTSPLDISATKEHESHNAAESCHTEILLPACSVVVTPLEVLIKENLKKLSGSTCNQPGHTTNTIETVISTTEDSVVGECSVLVTRLDDIIKQTMRKYTNNEERALNQPTNGEDFSYQNAASSENGLQQMKVHTVEKLYKCKYCQFTAFQKVTMKSHKKKHRFSKICSVENIENGDTLL